MSILQYGNDTISMGRVLNYSVSALMSEDGIDYIATRHDIDFQGVVSLDLGISAVAAANIMQQRITQPRQPFRLYVGGTTSDKLLLFSPAPDIQGGPKCNNVSFTQFANSRTAICNASFTVFTHDCSDIPRVLSNRWSVEHSMDQQQYTRRVVTGELRINPYYRLNADDAREYCFKGIPQGCQMVSGSFRQSPDGLRLSYTIIAQEKYQLPPADTTDIQSEYTETSENGARTLAEMFVDVAGTKTTPKATLIAIAFRTVSSRFNFAPPGQIANNGFDTFMGGVVREIMHDNRVSICLRAYRNQAVGNFAPLRIDQRFFGQPIPNAPDGKGQQLEIYGNAVTNGNGYKAVAAAWKGACTDAGQTVASGTNIDSNSAVGDGEAAPVQFSIGDLPAPPDDKISPAHRAAPIIDSAMEINHFRKTGVFPMPTAKSRSSITVDGLGSNPRPRTSSMVRLTQPLATKYITYSFTRIGEKPDQPIVTVKPGVTLIWHEFTVDAPTLAADGVTPVYHARGKIGVAYHTNIDVTGDAIRIGIDPTTTFDIEVEGTVNPGNFNPNMLEGSGP